MQHTGDTGTQSKEELEVMIAEKLESGKSRMEVVRALVQSGMTDAEAMPIVERVFFQMKKTAGEEEFSGGALVPAILGGLLAAVIGGAIWGGIAIWTGYEVGYVALGVGFLCGLGVVLFTGGKKGMPLQMIAVVTSILGVVIGKYGIFHHFFHEGLMQAENGAELAAAYGLFSVSMIATFIANLSAMASGIDLLWIGLAVYMAWSIPKASGLKT